MLSIIEVLTQVGNPTDAAILAALAYLLRDQIRPPRFETLAAGLVAVARREESVDDTALQSALEVPEREVADLQDVVACGPEEQADG